MKLYASLILAAVLLVVPNARAETFSDVLDSTERSAAVVRDELVSIRAENVTMRDALANAQSKNAIEKAAYVENLKQKDDAIGKLGATVKDQKRTLGKWYVVAVLAFVSAIKWFLIGAPILYLLVSLGLTFATKTPAFQIASWFVRNLPFAGICTRLAGFFHKTTIVSASVVPVITPPAVVESPSSGNAAYVANLKAMAQAEAAATEPDLATFASGVSSFNVKTRP